MKRRVIVLSGLAVLALIAGVSVSAQSGSISRLKPDPTVQKATGAIEKIHGDREIDGGRWRMTSYPNRSGARCLAQTVPNEAKSYTCLNQSDMFKGREVFAMHGGRQISSERKKLNWDAVWVHGFAGPHVKRLQLINLDCSVEEIKFDDDGGFMHIVGKAQIMKGVLPLKLLGLSSSGELIHEQDVSIGLPHNAKLAGLQEPRPDPACA